MQATTTTAQIHFDLFDHPMSPSDPLDRHLDVVADLVVLAKARCHVSPGDTYWVKPGLPEVASLCIWRCRGGVQLGMLQ
jgi:hypothetical protein